MKWKYNLKKQNKKTKSTFLKSNTLVILIKLFALRLLESLSFSLTITMINLKNLNKSMKNPVLFLDFC